MVKEQTQDGMRIIVTKHRRKTVLTTTRNASILHGSEPGSKNFLFTPANFDENGTFIGNAGKTIRRRIPKKDQLKED